MKLGHLKDNADFPLFLDEPFDLENKMAIILIQIVIMMLFANSMAAILNHTASLI